MDNQFRGLDTPPSTPSVEWWEDDFALEDEDADFTLEDDYSEEDNE